jgi:hypothetical protein
MSQVKLHISAGFNIGAFEVLFPEYLVVLLLFVDFYRGITTGAERIGLLRQQTDLFYCDQIIQDPVIAFHIVDQPGLVCITLPEKIDDQRQDVKIRLYQAVK